MQRPEVERRGLLVSLYGTAFMAALGFGFAWLAHSEAILLDGVFSAISFGMSLLALKVSAMVARDEDEYFHYGYAAFEPAFNVLKALLMAAVLLFALASAVSALLSGGRQTSLGSAVVYAVIATVGCVVIALALRRDARLSESELVAVDARMWLVDSAISGAVLVAFAVVFVLGAERLGGYVRFVDPVIVLFLVVITLPMPFAILRNSLLEVLLSAPPEQVQREVRAAIREAARALPLELVSLRMMKLGRTVYADARMTLAPEHRIEGVADLDRLRARLGATLSKRCPNVELEVWFSERGRLRTG